MNDPEHGIWDDFTKSKQFPKESNLAKKLALLVLIRAVNIEYY